MEISRTGRYTFPFHFRAMALEGIVSGAWQLNEVVARKSMGASTIWVALTAMSPSIALLLSAVFFLIGAVCMTSVMARTGKALPTTG